MWESEGRKAARAGAGVLPGGRREDQGNIGGMDQFVQKLRGKGCAARKGLLAWSKIHVSGAPGKRSR